MSAKGNSKRPPVPLDQYFTPLWAARQLVDHVLPIVRPGKPELILEPSAGTGVVVEALRAKYPASQITAIDVDARLKPWAGADHGLVADFEVWARGLGTKVFDLAAGNPPYSLAKEHITAARRVSKVVAFLVRQGFMCSAKRATWFRANNPSHVFMVPTRPRFDVPAEYLEKYPENEYGKWSSDSADYAWVCWDDRHMGPCELRWLPPITKEERAT